MVTLRRRVLVPTAVLGVVLAVIVGVAMLDALRASQALEARTATVRTVTALAYALHEASQDEDQALRELLDSPAAEDGTRIALATERIARLAREIDGLALSPRAAAIWEQLEAARTSLGTIRAAALEAAGRGDAHAVALERSRWRLMVERSDALLEDFAVHHLRSLDRAVAELQAGRVRALRAAILAAALGLLAAVATALAVARAVVRPIVAVAGAAEEIADTGRLSRVAGAERDDEIGKLARAFNRMTERLFAANAELEAGDRHKTEFLAMLSHELRNPLAALQNALHVLERADPASAPAGRARAVMLRQMRHLTRLVDDLLDVTRIARGKIELRRAPLDLGELVRRCGDDHRALTSARGLELTVEVPPAGTLAVDGDETRLAQVIGNLLFNAAKFTPRGGRIVLSAQLAGGAAEVRVRDTGIGIEASLLPRVFEPFTQAQQNLARPDGGLGLGLSLVKGIVELHGGTVTAHSAGPGHGAEFVIRVPVAVARAERSAAPASV